MRLAFVSRYLVHNAIGRHWETRYRWLTNQRQVKIGTVQAGSERRSTKLEPPVSCSLRLARQEALVKL